MKTYKITYVSWNVPAYEQHYFAALSATITKALWQVVFPERDLMALVAEKAGIEVKAIQFEEVNA